MGFVLFALGLFLGLGLMGAAWSHEETAAIRRGFIKLGDNLYRLTRISMNEWEDDE